MLLYSGRLMRDLAGEKSEVFLLELKGILRLSNDFKNEHL